jgi:hypothetical protein
MASTCLTVGKGACICNTRHTKFHGHNVIVPRCIATWLLDVLPHLGRHKVVCNLTTLSSHLSISQRGWLQQQHVLPNHRFQTLYEFVESVFLGDGGTKLQTNVPVKGSILLHTTHLPHIVKLLLQTPHTIHVSKNLIQLLKQIIEFKRVQITSCRLAPIHPPNQSLPSEQRHSIPSLLIWIHQIS